MIADYSQKHWMKGCLQHTMLFLVLVCLFFGCGGSERPEKETKMPQKKQSSIYKPTGKEVELSRRWREESQRYVAAINDFVRRGLQEGWENVDGEEPKDTRQQMAEAVLNALRRANQLGNTDGLHERFPRAHGPFLEMLKENGQELPVVLLLDDGRIVLQIGAPFESGRVVLIDDRKVTELPSEVITVGHSPNRKFFAVARREGATVHQGWEGPVSGRLKWPMGTEGVPEGFDLEPIQGIPLVTRLIPFNTGDRALLVSFDGIFVLTEDQAIRLLPTEDQLRERFEKRREKDPSGPLSYGLSMEHGAISPDGKLIAVGHQDSLHYLFDARTYNIVGEIGNLSEYPHYAAFSKDGSLVAFNSCHFYSGKTVGVPTKLLPGLKTKPYKLDDRLRLLQKGARVYAAVSRKDEFIIGDANGYLRAFDFQGTFRWQHFIGSSVGDMDISPDGKRLIVSTYAGFLSILDLDTGEADPFVIGTATHKERRRWLFWKNEPKPLIW